jgi:DNA polymerase
MQAASELTHILTDIRAILEEEQRLLGDILLCEPPSAKPATPSVHEPKIVQREEELHSQLAPKRSMTDTKEQIPDEPMLFDLPPTPAPSSTPITTERWGASASLDELNNMICECQKCTLGATRTKFVFGVGNPNATLMLIGEAPGADEDAQGEPFVGRAGQLLTKILEAIHFKRSDVYICNILKCRPPNNRKPTPEESELCKPYLKKQIALVKPKVILCLGLTAAENLLGTHESMSRLRGRVMNYEGVPVMVTYHPAALLRNPNWKRPTWEDVQAVRKLHDDLLKR